MAEGDVKAILAELGFIRDDLKEIKDTQKEHGGKITELEKYRACREGAREASKGPREWVSTAAAVIAAIAAIAAVWK